MGERWVQPELVPLAVTVGGRADLLGADVLAQLPVSAWGEVVTVWLPEPDVLHARLAEVGR